MGVRNKNSTDYVHPDEPNLLNIHKAMEYRDGVPHLRVNLGSDNITIAGNVNIADHITVDNTNSNPVPVTIRNSSLTVAQGTIPWQISKDAYANSNTNPIYTQFINNSLAVTGDFYPATQPVSLTSLPDSSVTIKNASLAVTGDFYPATQTVSGIVALDSASLAALETINANVSGTVTIQDGGNSITVDGSVNANVTFPTDITNADSNYEMNVARGLVTGQYVEMKNGYCPSMSSGGATVWSQGTLYPWASWTTAQRLFVVSSSASDTGQGLYIEGLDASYNKISETVTTNGTTAVQTTNSYLRINRGYLVSGNANVGTITQRLTSGSGTVIGGMVPGSSRNKQGVFTIPNGYTAYILYGDLTSYKNGQGQIDGQVDMKVRVSATTPFMTVFTSIAANGQYRNDFNVPLAVPQRSDIDVQFNSSGTCTVACNWEMILIPNA